jgi:hypothetical protein
MPDHSDRLGKNVHFRTREARPLVTCVPLREAKGAQTRSWRPLARHRCVRQPESRSPFFGKPALTCTFTWSGCRDLNPGPLDPQSSALTKLRHSPFLVKALKCSRGPHPKRSFANALLTRVLKRPIERLLKVRARFYATHRRNSRRSFWLNPPHTRSNDGSATATSWHS